MMKETFGISIKYWHSKCDNRGRETPWPLARKSLSDTGFRVATMDAGF